MIVATAGHVDHGKTALVKALTGVDTDRLPQEKARGISIDLGFAYAATPGGATLGFVDVPGHERFVRNMLAGVCGIDYVMLVVAADDGVMPQTREHLAIVDLLAVTRGVVVISKVDCVSAERTAEVCAQVVHLVASTGLAGAPTVAVSSSTGEGVGALRRLLDAAADAHSAAYQEHRGFRYAVDRAFSVPGSGTVATGTVFQGSVAPGDRVLLSPGAIEVRVRGIQKAGVKADRARAGERCALNLSGVDCSQVGRGRWVVAADASTTRFDAQLRLLADVSQSLRHWTPVHLHVGTADVAARVAIRRGAALAPGETAIVQLLCDTPVDVVVGDRFIIRDPSATQTLGGGVVIDPLPPARRMPRPAREAQLRALATLAPEAALPGLLDACPAGVDLVHFGRAFDLTQDGRDQQVQRAGAIVVGRVPPRALPATVVETVKNAVVVTLARFHAESPQAPGLELGALRRASAPALHDPTFMAILRMAAAELGIEVVGSIARRISHVATANGADEALWQRIKPQLLDAGFHGRLIRDLARDARVPEPVLSDFLHRKAATGELVRVAPQRFYPRELVAGLAALASAMAAEAPDHTFIAAQFRDRSGVNRTLAIEILECLDRLGITQRVADARKIRKDFVPILGPAPVPPPAAPRRPAPAPSRSGRGSGSQARGHAIKH
jgi:selenocysteine-specific elongation factor